MDEWFTVRQAAYDLEVSMSRVYALIASGTLVSKKQGLTTMVSRRSLATYKTSPNRNKYASDRSTSVDVEHRYTTTDLEDAGQATLEEEWSGLKPPTLSTEARRLYDASPIGARESRLYAQSGGTGGE